MERGHGQGAGPAQSVSWIRLGYWGGTASEAGLGTPLVAQNCRVGPSLKAGAGHRLGTRRRHPEVGVEWVLSEGWR